MAEVSVLNMEGNEVEKLNLNDGIFGVEINEHLVHLAVVSQLANNRQGTQSAKTRSEVRGGGRKPWRQKGTGHARQGSITRLYSGLMDLIFSVSILAMMPKSAILTIGPPPKKW